MVVVSVHNGGVLDEVEQKDEDHESGGDQNPTEEEIPINSESHHQLDAFVHFLSAKDPADCDGLEENAPRKIMKLFTVWKNNKFPATQILREINLENLEVQNLPFFSFRGSGFLILVNFSLQKLQKFT